MNTTLLFVELLIIGLEGWIWIFFFITSIFPIKNYANALMIFRDWELLVFAVFLALTYVLGVMIDRISDRIFRPLEYGFRDKLITNHNKGISVMRFSLGTQNDFLNQQLDYTRSRLRIVRASILNFIAITITVSLYLLITYPFTNTREMFSVYGIVIGIGGLASMFALLTLKSLIKAHLQLIQDMYDYHND